VVENEDKPQKKYPVTPRGGEKILLEEIKTLQEEA